MAEWFVKDKGDSVGYIGKRGGWRDRPRRGRGFRSREDAKSRLKIARLNYQRTPGFGPFVLVRVGKP